jgi:hypothetical protein
MKTKMKHCECSSSEESIIYFSDHMSHAEGILCCAFPETSDRNESFQTPGFLRQPMWLGCAPTATASAPRQCSLGCSLTSTNLWQLSRALPYLLSNKHRHKDSKNAGLLSCYLYQRLIDGVKGPRDVYDATTFPYELDVELNSQLQTRALQYLQEEKLNQRQLCATR